MTPCTYRRLASTVGKTHVQMLMLARNEVTAEKIEEFGEGAKDGKVKLKGLDLRDDPTMKSEAYRSLACALGKASVRELTLVNNDITDVKMQALEDGATKSRVKLEKLHIFGESNMTPCTYRSLASTVGKTHVQTLVLENNEVTAEKIEEFGEGAKDGKVKLWELHIINEDLDRTTMRQLPTVVTKTQLTRLALSNCKMTDDKFDEMADAAKTDGIEIIDEDLDRSTIRQLPKVVTKTQLTRLALINCKMTEDMFVEMADAANKDGIQIQEFFLLNMEMDESAYHGMARVVGKAQTRILLINACNITEKKLEAFGESAEANNAELWKLHIMNENLDRTTMRQIPTVVTKTQLTRLALSNCKMTDDKFDEMADAAKTDGIEIIDEDLDRSTIRQLPKVVTKTQLTSLALTNCKMTEDKFVKMADAANKDGIQIQEFFLLNMDMDEAAYHGIARVVGKAQTRILSIDACNITEKKLEAFGESAKENNAEIPEIQLSDKEMNEEAYRGLALVVGKAQTRILNIDACNLTQKKLQAFGESAKENDTELDDISIWFDPVDAAGFREFAKTMKTVNANIACVCYCQLTAKKLQSFKQSLKQNNVKLNTLGIENDDLDDECYDEITEICNIANAELHLRDRNVPDERVLKLRMHIRNVILLP